MVNDGKNIAIGRDEHNPISVYQQQIEDLRGKPGITESNIVFAHALAGMVYKDMAAKTARS